MLFFLPLCRMGRVAANAAAPFVLHRLGKKKTKVSF
jgi:hypothetical protein